MAVLAQTDLKQPAHPRFVFNDKNVRHFQDFCVLASACKTAAGNSTRKQAPCPGTLTSLSDPPWASTILETIASPSPTPDFFVVTNGLKICSFNSGGIPGPLSSISTTTLLSLVLSSDVLSSDARSLTRKSPPCSPIASQAF